MGFLSSITDIIKPVAAFLDPASTAVSGAAKIIGSLNRPDPVTAPSQEAQGAVQLQHARDDFNQKMALAKEHGLHPLSVLGVPSSGFSPVLTSGQPDGFDYNAFGSGVSQLGSAAASLVKPPDTPAPVDPRQERLLDAQVRRAEAMAGTAEMDYILSQRAVLGQPGKPPGARASNDVNAAESMVAAQSGVPLNWLTGERAPIKVEQKVAPPHPSKMGTAAGVDQGWVDIKDKNGRTVSTVRNEAVQADIEKGATFQALANMFGIERALQITAVMENENLLLAGSAGLAFALSRIPGGRALATRMGLLKPLTQPYKPNWKGGK